MPTADLTLDTTAVTSESAPPTTPEACDVREGHPNFSDAIQRQLLRTPIAQWSALAVMLDTETHKATIMLRADLAGWLRANDLKGLAHEITARRVGHGALLVLILKDSGSYTRILFENATTKRRPR